MFLFGSLMEFQIDSCCLPGFFFSEFRISFRIFLWKSSNSSQLEINRSSLPGVYCESLLRVLFWIPVKVPSSGAFYEFFRNFARIASEQLYGVSSLKPPIIPTGNTFNITNHWKKISEKSQTRLLQGFLISKRNSKEVSLKESTGIYKQNSKRNLQWILHQLLEKSSAEPSKSF